MLNLKADGLRSIMSSCAAFVECHQAPGELGSCLPLSKEVFDEVCHWYFNFRAIERG